MTARPLLMVLAASLAIAACTAGTGPSAPAPAAVPVCETLPVIAPPEEAFRDAPIYVANEMPEDEIGEWARTRPGFEVLWIDREHGGWVVVAFSSDVAARQAELTEAFPDAGAVAVQVDWKMADLERLRQRVSDELRSQFDSYAVGIDVMRGHVDVGIGVLSEDRIAMLDSRFAGEPVCVSGIPPADAIPEGPQPSGGEGWRLLASEKVGEAYRTGIAADAGAYETLWQEIGLTGDPPVVDFQAEVVIWFGAVYGSSCPDIRLDDVVSDQGRQIVHGTIVLPSTVTGCTADANPHAFMVAVERSLLPRPPFALQLNAEDPPAGAPQERTIIDADLREPGSVPGPGDVHADPDLPGPYAVEPGSVIEPGFEQPFRLDVRCGIEWLGPLNDYWWRTAAATGERFVPEDWEPLVEDGAIIVSVLLRTDPEPTITATAADHSIVYRPVRQTPRDCR